MADKNHSAFEVPLYSSNVEFQYFHHRSISRKVKLQKRWVEVFAKSIKVYTHHRAVMATFTFTIGDRSKLLYRKEDILKQCALNVEPNDETMDFNLTLGLLANDQEYPSVIILLSQDKASFMKLQKHLELMLSPDHFMMENVQLVRKKQPLLDRIPTYDIMTRILNNQLETPIVRVKSGSGPMLGGPFIHEFKVAYLAIKGNVISVASDAKMINVDPEKKAKITALTRILIGHKVLFLYRLSFSTYRCLFCSCSAAILSANVNIFVHEILGHFALV